jgi:hypothetical protein
MDHQTPHKNPVVAISGEAGKCRCELADITDAGLMVIDGGTVTWGNKLSQPIEKMY